jgi:hypothetical protein
MPSSWQFSTVTTVPPDLLAAVGTGWAPRSLGGLIERPAQNGRALAGGFGETIRQNSGSG